MHFNHGRSFDHCITYMYTQRPPDDEGGGHTMHRDKVPSHMYHKICTYQRDATTLYSLTIDRVQARIQDLREEGLSQVRIVWSISKKGLRWKEFIYCFRYILIGMSQCIWRSDTFSCHARTQSSLYQH